MPYQRSGGSAPIWRIGVGNAYGIMMPERIIDGG
jgi:hypothetical protein